MPNLHHFLLAQSRCTGSQGKAKTFLQNLTIDLPAARP
jgi:hypothetical protein